MPVVTSEARQQARAHERRFTGTRRSQNHKQSGRWRYPQAAQVIERFDRRRIATKEYAGVLSFERTKTAIGWPIRIIGWRPSEEFAINSELFDGSVKTHSIDPYQPRNIFELLLAHILKY